jgi:glycosyltransferase involved in cell wall biosynthesis
VDLFVLSSIQKGQGMALLEAQAAALPVVVFNVSGAREAVRNKETGLLVNEVDSNSLAEAILKLLPDKSLSKKWGNMAENSSRKTSHGIFVLKKCSKSTTKQDNSCKLTEATTQP